eukprot:364362-Chlamydomonas_euryale.AAC.21
MGTHLHLHARQKIKSDAQACQRRAVRWLSACSAYALPANGAFLSIQHPQFPTSSLPTVHFRRPTPPIPLALRSNTSAFPTVPAAGAFPLIHHPTPKHAHAPLPCAKRKASTRDRHREAGSHQRRLDVRRHVIWALVQVAVHVALWRNAVERVVEIQRHVWARVLVDRQRRAGVQDCRTGRGEKRGGRGGGPGWALQDTWRE